MFLTETLLGGLGRGWGGLMARIRGWYLRFFFARVGAGVIAREGIVFRGGKNIKIGKNCYLGRNIVFDASHGEIVIGDGVEIRDGVKIYSKKIVIGAQVTLAEGVFLNGVIDIADGAWLARGCDLSGEVKLAKVILGPYTTCVAGDGHDRDSETGAYLMKSSPKGDACIVLEKGCWTGARSVLLSGVKVGENTLIGAGAVVTKSFSAGSVVVGNPGRSITEQQKV